MRLVAVALLAFLSVAPLQNPPLPAIGGGILWLSFVPVLVILY